MKIAFYLNIISPHQLPLAREVARLVGEEDFKYVYAEDFLADRKALGWNDGDAPAWCMKGDEDAQELIDADLVYTGIRCVGLMARRSALGKKTMYYSERWFKPKLGAFRLLSASYWRMARKIVRLIEDGGVEYLSCGIHSARDMARLCGLMHGDLRCLFRAPKLEFEHKPGGRIFEGRGKREEGRSIGAMRMWGYFVEEGRRKKEEGRRNDQPVFHILWVGRFLDWKLVDAIIRAVGKFSKRVNPKSSPTPTSNFNSSIISLDIYGTGPEEARLKKLAAKYGDAIKFHSSVPIDEVRKLMREHDVYVLSSNAYEGWGAVVSEALEEGMKVIGTYEAGSSATILPKERLFHSGDYKALAALLEKEYKGELPPCSIGDWTARDAARQLLEIA